MSRAKKWRIKKTTTGYGEWYVLQKRLFGFLWWYSPDNKCGSYSTLEQAMEMCPKKATPTTVEIIEIP